MNLKNSSENVTDSSSEKQVVVIATATTAGVLLLVLLCSWLLLLYVLRLLWRKNKFIKTQLLTGVDFDGEETLL